MRFRFQACGWDACDGCFARGGPSPPKGEEAQQWAAEEAQAEGLQPEGCATLVHQAAAASAAAAVAADGVGEPSAAELAALLAEELRIDPTDGMGYPLASFVEEYGGSIDEPPRQWRQAAVCHVPTVRNTPPS